MSNESIMLAHPLTQAHIKNQRHYTISEKLDGVACRFGRMATGVWKPITRQWEDILSIQHITDELNAMELNSEIQGIVGELYIRNKPLSYISGLVRRLYASPELEFWIYPEFGKGIDTSLSSKLFKIYAVSGVHGSNLHHCIKHGVIKIDPALHLIMADFRQNHPDSKLFEGYIARDLSSPWVAGKRSPAFLKIVERPTLDLRVIRLVQAISKYGESLGRVGAFIVEWQGGEAKVGAGRMSHPEAEQLWTDNFGPEEIIEVGYKPDASYQKLRSPVFHRFRIGKTSYDTTFPEERTDNE